MLGKWRCHADYQQYLVKNILPFYITQKASVEYYQTAFSKLYILDLDVLKPVLEPYYSHTGKPSKNQAEIFRSFVLASELGYHSIPQWVAKLKSHDLLCHMIGLSPSEVPGVGCHYDFINRLWLENPDVEQ